MTRGESLLAYLRELRRAEGLTQAAAGERSRLGREVWNKLENGKTGLGEVRAARIAEAFGRPYAELERFITPRGQAIELVAALARLEARIERVERVVGLQSDEGEPQARAGAK